MCLNVPKPLFLPTKIAGVLLFVLGALASAQEDRACALSNHELQRTVGLARHRAVVQCADEALLLSAEDPVLVNGSLAAHVILEHAGWLASEPAKEQAKATARRQWALMQQMAKEQMQQVAKEQVQQVAKEQVRTSSLEPRAFLRVTSPAKRRPQYRPPPLITLPLPSRPLSPSSSSWTKDQHRCPPRRRPRRRPRCRLTTS